MANRKVSALTEATAIDGTETLYVVQGGQSERATATAVVSGAGAVMESDTTTAAMSFVIDEDNMASDSATKVPTQQSVKAYADTKQPLNANLTTLAGIVPKARFDTRAAASGANIPASVTVAETGGYAATTDGGDAQFAVGPALEVGGFTDLSGRHFEIIPAPRYKPSPFGILPEDAGAAALINDAMEWLNRRRGGGAIEFLPETYFINETVINQYDNVILRGLGGGYSRNGGTDYESAGTLFDWTGAVGGTVARMTAVDGGLYALKGAGFHDIGINCDGVAAKGLEVLSMQGGGIHGLTVYEATSVALEFNCVANLTSDPEDNQANSIDRVTVVHQTAGSGKCILISGNTVANTSLNRFGLLTLLHYGGNALEFDSSDGNIIQQVRVFRHPSGTARGIMYRAGATTDHARNNLIVFAQAHVGGVYAEGTASGAQPSINNVILSHSFGNGTPSPAVEDGAVFSYGSDGGVTRSARDDAAVVHSLFRKGAVANGILGQVEFRGPDSVGTDTRYGYVAGRLVTATNAAEDGQVEIVAVRGGAETVVGSFGAGLKINSGSEIKRVLTASAALDFPSVAASGGVQALTISVPGATVFDSVSLGLPSNGGSNSVIYTAYVSAADTVTVRATNTSAGAIDPASQTFRVTVFGF